MKRTITTLVDDLDGTENDSVETLQFGLTDLDGVYRLYEIDLDGQNRQIMAGVLEPFVAVARPLMSGKKSTPTGKSRAKRDDTAALRDWARNNGHEVAARGRIPAEIRTAYEAAQSVRQP